MQAWEKRSQLKAGRDQMARDNANLSEQLKASQEQFARAVGQLSEQLKISQEQLVRDNANVAGQIKGIQEQLTSVISRATEQNAPPRITATAPRPAPPPLQRTAAPAVRGPVTILPPPRATALPRGEKPRITTSLPASPTRWGTFFASGWSGKAADSLAALAFIKAV
ncbi:MAG: hypothetical protein Q8M31_00625 [Beijerinckiaceae bacterium]|nr:hypothetical protein [Beijerinckiaceae bacterium]